LSLNTPTQFGKYELLERLGAGGMAVVYRARYTAAPGVTKPVVIKRVLGHYAEAPEFVAMFIQEARISVGLNHGNIVQVFDFGQVDGEYFLAMELVEGQPLSSVLKRAHSLGLPKLPPPLAVLIAIEMCKGLHHAHTRNDETGRPLGLIHRDISPDNVLVSYEGEVKIADFGIAKAQLAGRPVTEAGMVKGKIRYMAPEQMRGEPLDARSDVFAVGVVLYRMLCGRLPVDGTGLEVMQQVLRGQLTHPRQLNPDLDGGLIEILMEALAIKREARISSAEALHQQLSHWLATRAPLFPVNALKHLLGALFEQELRALGRPPQLPPKFQEQLALWRGGSTPEPTPAKPRQLRPAGRTPSASKAAPAATREQPAMTGEVAERVPTAPDKASVGNDGAGTDRMPATGPTQPVSSPGESSEGAPSGSSLMERVSLLWLWVSLSPLAVVVLLKLFWPVMFPELPLEILSEPSGALVTVNDTVQGVTPLKVKGLSDSERVKIELSMPGMKPWAHIFQPGLLNERLQVTLEPVKTTQPKQSPSGEVPFSSRFGTEQLPARFTLQEKWHSFSPTRRSLQQKLFPEVTYTVQTTGQYAGKTALAKQDMTPDGSQALFQSSQFFVFLEADELPPGERLFKASARPISFSGARMLHAFVITGTSSEFYENFALTLRLNSPNGGDSLLPVDPRRFAHVVALENRYSVRRLDPGLTYALEVRARPGVPSSAVAMLAVPATVDGQVVLSGQLVPDFQYALQAGSYTVQGARELWFSLPRWEQDGEAQMDLSVEPLPAP